MADLQEKVNMWLLTIENGGDMKTVINEITVVLNELGFKVTLEDNPGEEMLLFLFSCLASLTGVNC